MINAGTLRKRAKRPLVKVNGLGAVPYDEIQDQHMVHSILDKVMMRPDSKIQRTGTDARVKMAISKFNNLRITRDPKFHEGIVDVEQGFGTKIYPEASIPTSHQYDPSQAKCDRPYLLGKSYFNRIRLIIFFGILCFNFPWKWNNKKKRIDPWNPTLVKLWKLYWYFTTVQSLFMITYQMYKFSGIYSRDLESYRPIFAYSLIIYWYACHLGYKTCIFIYGDRMRKYVNTLLDFNQEYVEKYLQKCDKFMEFSSSRLIIKFSIPAAATQITNSLFFFITLPSAPYYLTSLINPRPWYALIPGAFQDFTMVGQTILTYITISWIQVAHTSSMEFWLREMHKDTDSEYTSEDIRNFKVSVSTYRQLQLLCTSFNDCMAPLCYPVWKFSVAFGFIPCGYLWIRSMNKLFIEEFPGILVYPIGTFNCFTMGFGCLSMAAQMYDIANSFIYSWSRTRQQEFRRVLMSFPTLKVKVGRYYMITAATTITFFQVITGYVIDCIITFP